MDTSSIWVGLAALGGWLLGQLGQLSADVGRRFLLKRQIKSELVQIVEECDRVWISSSRSLQICALGGIDHHVALPISDMVFASQYADASLVFTRVQRTSMEMIHTYVKTVNRRLENLEAIISGAADASRSEEPLELHRKRYHSALRALMMTTAMTRWGAVYHLRRPDFPVLEPDSEDMDSYRAYLDEREADLDHTEKSVVGLTLEDFKSHARKERDKWSDLDPTR